ncbi:MAG: 5-oxoprolinase subunit PxpA [Fimbriiglobus sp.]
MTLHLNADLGEGGPHDAELLTLVDAANICCASYAGDPVLTRRTLEMTQAVGVQAIAHPGYFDRDSFGRRELHLTPTELGAQLQYQLGGFLALARLVGVEVKWMKPHGALYNQAMRSEPLAKILAGVAMLHGLGLVGSPGTVMEQVATELHLPYRREGFADRRYLPNGQLVPRTEMNAMIHNIDEAIAQAERLVSQNRIDTLCVHGDHPESLALAQGLRQRWPLPPKAN